MKTTKESKMKIGDLTKIYVPQPVGVEKLTVAIILDIDPTDETAHVTDMNGFYTWISIDRAKKMLLASPVKQ
jgi:hypothetical protein|tara:strand:+ start:273 stop:488 length:216 start_codon:yes stop_codon:yes gene_type:complete